MGLSQTLRDLNERIIEAVTSFPEGDLHPLDSVDGIGERLK